MILQLKLSPYFTKDVVDEYMKKFLLQFARYWTLDIENTRVTNIQGSEKIILPCETAKIFIT